MQGCRMGGLNNKDLFSIASPFWDQRKEGTPVLDQTGQGVGAEVSTKMVALNLKAEGIKNKMRLEMGT